MNAAIDSKGNRVVINLMGFYENFSADRISGLDGLYTQDVEFVDPIHRVEGILSLKSYMKKMAKSLIHYRIRYQDVLIGDNSAYLTWEMEFANKRIRGGEVITVRGMSCLKFTSRVYYHEDSYDLGALVYEHLPLLGGITRSLKNRLAEQAS
jgi:hypothetical protein